MDFAERHAAGRVARLGVPRRTSTPPRKLRHHWYLAEWAAALGRTQSDAVRELGWNKSSASHLWNGKQRYSQDYVDEVSIWLNIRPYELLMPPDLAMAIRRLREAAPRLAADVQDQQPPEAATG